MTRAHIAINIYSLPLSGYVVAFSRPEDKIIGVRKEQAYL